MFDWFVLSMCIQVILDSPFASPGLAPIGGGKKGEFRDWTEGDRKNRKLKENIKCTNVTNSNTKQNLLQPLLSSPNHTAKDQPRSQCLSPARKMALGTRLY